MRAIKAGRAMALAFGAFVLAAAGVAGAVSLEPSSLAVKVGETKYIAIKGASGAVALGVSDYSKVSARLAGSAIEVKGKEIGEARITVRDQAGSAAASVSVSAGTAAAPAPSTSVSGSGRLLASNCAQCHGTNGSGGFEALRGKSASDIYNELKEEAANLAVGNEIMDAHAKGYTDAQMRAIADFLSKQ